MTKTTRNESRIFTFSIEGLSAHKGIDSLEFITGGAWGRCGVGRLSLLKKIAVTDSLSLCSGHRHHLLIVACLRRREIYINGQKKTKCFFPRKT